MPRENPSYSQKKRLFKANKNRCCVCKENNIGLEIHHIDGNNSNTIDENLAVICAEDHDTHHRPKQYKCTNISQADLKKFKIQWEQFVEESNKKDPNLLATINAFGTEDFIHSAKLIMQWGNTKEIIYEKVYHLHMGSIESWADNIIEEIKDFKNIPLVIISEPIHVEHCTDCDQSLSHVVNPNFAIRLTNPEWKLNSLMTIYINPSQASLAFVVFFKNENIFSGSIHLCQKKYLHVITQDYDEKLLTKRTPSVRTQVTNIIKKIIQDWEPTQVIIGTNDENKPTIIQELILPKFWEFRA